MSARLLWAVLFFSQVNVNGSAGSGGGGGDSRRITRVSGPCCESFSAVNIPRLFLTPCRSLPQPGVNSSTNSSGGGRSGGGGGCGGRGGSFNDSFTHLNNQITALWIKCWFNYSLLVYGNTRESLSSTALHAD